MKRRKFIQATGTIMSLPILLNGMKVGALEKSSIFSLINDESDRVLVLIQLNGGNDGLNTIIPRDQYSALSQVRPSVLLPEGSLLNLTNTVSLHPAMTGVKSLYDDGELGIVQSVSYPNHNRSHFRSLDIWYSGSPAEEFWTTGWLGRHFDSMYPYYPDNYPNDEHPDPFAITMGSVVSETCQGVGSNFSMTLNDPFNLTPLADGGVNDAPDTPYGEELSFLRTSIAQTNAYAETVSAAVENGASVVNYPEGNELARQLRNVAYLISGGLRTKVYVVNLGGFDTHANQVEHSDHTKGAHADLLKYLSDAMAAFQSDLRAQGLEERVIGMTFSEFGRRIIANNSLGTDHGTAAPLMLFGSCVKPQILGDNPEISPSVGSYEGVPMQYDFRDIYGTILLEWFGVPEDKVRHFLYQDFNRLPILRECSQTSVTALDALAEIPVALDNYPNPFRGSTTVSFQCQSEMVKLSVFDQLGSELKVLVNKRLPEGDHQINFDARDLPAGSYFYRLQLEGRQKTKRMVKVG